MSIANVEFATKLLIPRRSEHVIRRQRLIDLLHSNVHLRAQVISAPAGYGKTTLLADFAGDIETPVCWYSLDVLDRDPRILLEGVLASIRSHFPLFGQLTQSHLFAAEDIEKEALHLVCTLAGEIHSMIPEYFVLVLEDYHLVEGSRSARTLLDLLLERTPDNCHIILSSRIPVELPAISRLMSQQRVTNLDTTALRFTTNETKKLLATSYNLALSNEDADKLTVDTEGWVTGILLSIDRLRKSRQHGELLTVSRRDVFTYLAYQVLDRQPTQIRNFLLVTSTLNDMRPDICNDLLESADSLKLFRYIERQNLFIQCIDYDEAWYRYHHLFRDFLQSKLLEENADRFYSLHSKAASIYERGQRWNEAITHFLAARRYDEASRLVKTVGEDSLKSGKWATVLRWVEALPRDVCQSDPDLILLHAQSLVHLGEIDKAIPMLTDLLCRTTNGKDWLYKAKALSSRSAAFRLAGLFVEAKTDIEDAIRLLEQHKASGEILGGAYRRLGNIYAEQGRFNLALKHMRNALKCYSSILDVDQMAATHSSLGIMHKRLGNLTKASMHFEQARKGWQKTGNLGALASLLNNIGIVYQRLGQYDLALNALRSGLEKARETGYRRAEACILINTAEVLRDLNLYDEALARYQEGLELARQVMETYYIAWATAGIGETYRLLGDHDKAYVLITQAIAQAEEQGQKYEATLFAIHLGAVEYGRGRYDTAIRILQTAARYLGDIGDKDALARAYFHLAQTSFLAKEYDTAINWLEKVSTLADELGYDDFLATEGKSAILLVEFASQKGVGGVRFRRVMEQIRRQRDVRSVWASAANLGGSLTKTKPEIEAYCLGKTRVIVDSRLVTELEWRSNRAKELFFYLLCCGKGQTKECITAALWPDLPPAKATSNFHINLYRARRAISPGLFTVEQGQYAINPAVNIRLDTTEFEKHLSEADKMPQDTETTATNLQQAIKLYNGPFMEEFYTEWVEARRRKLEDKYLKALFLLASYNILRQKYQSAINLLEEFIRVDPYNDQVYYQMMECYLSLGDKVSALRTYKWYLDNVACDVGVVPSAQIEELHKRMLTNKQPA
jgi:ATP/maltotriose-dependent transcriptional regulator MalT/two-component SAPR family response regulator